MNIRLFLLGIALILTPFSAVAQDFLPGRGVGDQNPYPTKAMCWTAGKFGPCPAGGGSSVPSGTAGSPTSSVLSVQGVPSGSPITTTITNTPLPVTATLTNTPVPTTVTNTSIDTRITNATLSTTITNASIGTTVGGQLPTGTNTIGRVLPGRDATPVAAAGYSSSSAFEAGRVLKNAAGNLFGLNVMSGASGGYVMIFNAATIPADGAVTPVKCYALAANSSLDLNYRATPTYFATGIVAVFSTTGCFTKTGSATAFFSGDVK